jgi:hypothetical protein
MAGRLFATAAQLSLALFGFGMCVRDLINRRIRHGIFAGGHKLMDGHIVVVEPPSTPRSALIRATWSRSGNNVGVVISSSQS